ncbi:MAG: TonB-dependent receptor domain-containing protein [Sandaracinaceae bacterium]
MAPLAAAPEGGHALLELVVGAAGVLESVSVLQAEPASASSAVGEAARAHARASRFEPGAVDGQAVRASVRLIVRFPPLTQEPAPEGERSLGDAEAQASAEVPSTGETPTIDAGGAEPPEPAPSAPVSEDQPHDEGVVEGQEEGVPEGQDEGVPEGQDDGFGVNASVDTGVETPEASAASDRDVEIGELSRVPRDNAQNILTLYPGLLISQTQNEGHAASIFLRGFDAEEGEDLEILLEGIPLNEPSQAHGHGYADTLVIIPELVQAVRVVAGPFDPSQGDFAVAGTADFRLGVPERGVHGTVGFGSYAQRRLSLVWGPEGQSEGTVAGFRYEASNGWGTNRAYSNIAATGQYEGRVSGNLNLRLLAFGGGASWGQAGLIREDDFESQALPCAPTQFEQFYCTYDPRQGGSAARAGGALELIWREGPSRVALQIFGMGRSARFLENFTGFLTDPRQDGGLQRGDLTDQRYDAVTIGMRGSYRRRFSVFGEVQQIELGVYVRQDFADTVLDRILDPSLPGPPAAYATDFDRNVRVLNAAAYARLDARFTDWLGVMGGVRVDGFSFRVLDRNTPALDEVAGPLLGRQATDAFGVLVQPRGTVRVDIVDGLRWSTSVGLGARSSDAAALSDDELAPFAEVIAMETGLTWRIGEQDTDGIFLTGGAVAFFTRVSQDLIFDATAGRNTVTGPSHRTGATVDGRIRVGRWFDSQLAITYTRGHLPPVNAGVFDLFAGPRLPFIPEWLVRSDTSLSHTLEIGGEPFTGSVALGALFLGPRPLPLNEFSSPWFVLDAAASVRWRWFEVGVQAQNFLDLRYRSAEFNYVSNFRDPGSPPSMMAARHFAAAPPIRILALLRVHVAFDAPNPWASAQQPDPPSPSTGPPSPEAIDTP